MVKSTTAPSSTGPSAFLPGQWVEVRTAAEILSTLDGNWAVDGLPFMPEMLPYCGNRFKVLQCAERVCPYPPTTPFRKLKDCVLLEGLRCDGASHGGCQLGCMLLWKESWLKRVEGPSLPFPPSKEEADIKLPSHRAGETTAYFCQATELPVATLEGDPLWRPGQYLGFILKRTFSLGELISTFSRMVLRRGLRLLRFLFPAPTKVIVPDLRPLGLVPGQWVKVKTWDEIKSTLDQKGRLKGLGLSTPMMELCGRIFKVHQRVETIIDESTGHIRKIQTTVCLENAYCDRFFGCARRMPFLWREAWLTPVDAAKGEMSREEDARRDRN